MAPRDDSPAFPPTAPSPSTEDPPPPTGSDPPHEPEPAAEVVPLVMEPSGCGYNYILDGDFVQPFDFHLPSVHALRASLTLGRSDVVIATYPKCGTTWMQQLVLLLLRGADAPPFAPMREAPWLEVSASSAATHAAASSPPLSVGQIVARTHAEAQSGRHAWKTHAAVRKVPWRGGVAAAAAAAARLVVVSRNPKDTAVSMFHHTVNIPPFGFRGGWDDFARLFLAGRVESSSFWEWHREWWAAAQEHRDAVLWVRFEEMKADLVGVVRRVAEHLQLERSEEEVRKIAARCGFDAMKSEAEARDSKAGENGGYVKKGHFRSGTVGGYRSVMSAETEALFDAKTEELAALGCDLRD